VPFRLRSDAEKWFSEIDGREPTKTKFDLYYFCLMAGLTSGRSSDPAGAGVQAREIIDDWIQDYKPAQRLLIGLLVVAELRKGGINLQEKSAVRGVFKRLVSPNSSTGLTDEGMRCMNAYASGGYEYMAESRETKPASVEEFLRDYLLLIDDATSAAA
jgi:hypothetical protein